MDVGRSKLGQREIYMQNNLLGAVCMNLEISKAKIKISNGYQKYPLWTSGHRFYRYIAKKIKVHWRILTVDPNFIEAHFQ